MPDAVIESGWCVHSAWLCLGVGVPTATHEGVEYCRACHERWVGPWPAGQREGDDGEVPAAA